MTAACLDFQQEGDGGSTLATNAVLFLAFEDLSRLMLLSFLLYVFCVLIPFRSPGPSISCGHFQPLISSLSVALMSLYLMTATPTDF